MVMSNFNKESFEKKKTLRLCDSGLGLKKAIADRLKTIAESIIFFNSLNDSLKTYFTTFNVFWNSPNWRRSVLFNFYFHEDSNNIYVLPLT